MDAEQKIVLDTDEIERLRKERGWSVTHLVERAGISRPTYYKVLADAGQASLDIAGKLAGGLEVHPFDILKAAGYPAPLQWAPRLTWLRYDDRG